MSEDKETPRNLFHDRVIFFMSKKIIPDDIFILHQLTGRVYYPLILTVTELNDSIWGELQNGGRTCRLREDATKRLIKYRKPDLVDQYGCKTYFVDEWINQMDDDTRGYCKMAEFPPVYKTQNTQ